ncbi:MAG: DNA internalization-related competence protein ComEC/Rec2 [Desulfobacterales bacterium]|nr:DNA internalization-related competence protein ComEC/Rec2 [Desulfobacterales bacterium]
MSFLNGFLKNFRNTEQTREINKTANIKRPYKFFIPFASALILGIVFGSYFPGYRNPAWLLFFLCLVSFIYGFYGGGVALPFLVILFSAWGYLSIQPFVAPRFPPDHISRYANGDKWIVTGIIDEKPVEKNYRVVFILRVEKLGKNTHVTGKLRVSAKGKSPHLSLGDKVSFISRIKRIKSFSNPGGFDYKRYMAFKKIWATAYARRNMIEILEKGSVNNFRISISEFIDNTIKQKNIKGVLKALIIGDRTEIPQPVRMSFASAGIAHLLAISGLHIGIVTSFAFIIFRWTVSRLKYFLREPLFNRVAAFLSFFPLVGYGLIAGSSPSTQRAVILVSAYLVAILVEEEEQNAYNTLALAAILILLVHPPSVFSVSFQLSFSAVFSIMYGMSKTFSITIKQWDQFHIRQKLFSFFCVSFFATMGTLPITMYHFNQFSMTGLLANFIFIPLIGFVAVPLGLFSVLLHMFGIFPDTLFLKLSAYTLAVAFKILPLFSSTSFAVTNTITPTFFEICCYYLLGWTVLNLFDNENTLRLPKFLKLRKSFSIPGADESFIYVSMRKLAISAGVIVFIAVVADVCFWIHKRFRHSDLRIAIIDVGQASSALLELPGGYCILIDGGGFYDNNVFDVGKNIVAPFLCRKKIKTIDTIVLSHPDSDHLNGLLYIVKHFNVKNVWTNNEQADTRIYTEFRSVVGNRMAEFKNIFGRHNINGVELEILYPPKDFTEQSHNWRNANNNSLVVKVKFGSVSFLFPADIEEDAEKELVETAGDKLKSTVLIAPHHGSRTSSTEIFLDYVQPEYVVVSASGWSNIPHPSVISRYKKRGYQIFRTDENGAVSMSADGKTLKIRPCRFSDK